MASLLVSAQLRAQPRPPTEADRLFEEGRALAKEGKYADACDRFTKSFEIDHALGTELNLADCQEKLGHLRLAWKLFLAAADESQRSDDTKRTEFARSRAEALAAKLTEVVINVANPTATGLTITIAGHTIEPAPVIRDRTEPGMIEIVATMPDREPFKVSNNGVAGGRVTVDVPVFGPAVAHRPPPPPPPPLVERDRRRPDRVHLAWGLAAGGGAAAIVGTVLAFKGRSDYNTVADGAHCERVTGGVKCDATGDSQLGDARRLANIGTGFAIGAGALVIGAAVVFYTAPVDHLMVTPTAAADRVGLAVSGAF